MSIRAFLIFYFLNVATVNAFVALRQNGIHHMVTRKLSTNKATTTTLSSSQSSTIATENIKNIILFDGVCNFCNSWVDLVLQVDSEKKFKFCALQSDSGRKLLQSIGKDADDISSVVFIKSPTEFYFKSEAALKVAETMGPAYAVVSALGRTLVPIPFLRDSVYDLVADNRYRILGKRTECRCADPAFQDRFL